MKYRIKISEKIEKKIVKFPKKIRLKIFLEIDHLANNPRPEGCKKLKSSQSPPLYRIRIGDYRVVYSIQDSQLLILVIEIGHRKDIYKQS